MIIAQIENEISSAWAEYTIFLNVQWEGAPPNIFQQQKKNFCTYLHNLIK